MSMSDSQTFWELVKRVAPEATITNFVLICEVHDSDKPSLKLVTSELMTPWLAEGMLNFGLAMITRTPHEDEEVS